MAEHLRCLFTSYHIGLWVLARHCGFLLSLLFFLCFRVVGFKACWTEDRDRFVERCLPVLCFIPLPSHATFFCSRNPGHILLSLCIIPESSHFVSPFQEWSPFHQQLLPFSHLFLRFSGGLVVAQFLSRNFQTYVGETNHGNGSVEILAHNLYVPGESISSVGVPDTVCFRWISPITQNILLFSLFR
jgi:hypothetical protein